MIVNENILKKIKEVFFREIEKVDTVGWTLFSIIDYNLSKELELYLRSDKEAWLLEFQLYCIGLTNGKVLVLIDNYRPDIIDKEELEESLIKILTAIKEDALSESIASELYNSLGYYSKSDISVNYGKDYWISSSYDDVNKIINSNVTNGISKTGFCGSTKTC